MTDSYFGNDHEATLSIYIADFKTFNLRIYFKELSFLNILIKTKMNKLSQIFTTNTQTFNNSSILRVTFPKTANNPSLIPYQVGYAPDSLKKTLQVCLDESCVTIYQTEYYSTLINKRFELAEKIPLKELRTPQKISTKKPLNMSQHKTKQPRSILRSIKELNIKD